MDSLAPLFVQSLLWPIIRLYLNLFCSLKVNGLNNLSKFNKPLIFAANHASEFDAFIIPASLRFSSGFMPLFYVSREQQFYKKSGWRQKFYGGKIFNSLGAYPALTGLNDYSKSLHKHIQLLKSGNCVVIFPEGKKTQDGKIQTAKGGVIFLSSFTNVPIVPVKIEGSFGIKFINRRPITITFGYPTFFDSSYFKNVEKCKQGVSSLMKLISAL